MLINESNFDEIAELLTDEKEIAFDTETTGLNPFKSDYLIGVSAYLPVADIKCYFPFRHTTGYNLPDSYVAKLGAVIFKPELVHTWNGSFDLHMTYREGWTDPKAILEGMICLHLLDENRSAFKKNYKLKDVADEFLGSDSSKEEKFLNEKYGKKHKSEMAKIDPVDLEPYASDDAYMTYKLNQFFLPHLAKWNQVELAHERSRFLLKVLIRMVRNGIMLNPDEINKQIADLEPQIASELAWFQNKALELGYHTTEFNPNSSQQLKILFKCAGITLDSTDAPTMSAYVEAGNEIAIHVQNYKHAIGAPNKFYKPYLEDICPDKRLHIDANVIGTGPGRISWPRIHQVPKGNTYPVKKVFVATPGYDLFEIDYSALEMRLAAHFAKQRSLQEVFNQGFDPHQFTADALGIDRNFGKQLNFALLYRMGVEKLATKLGIDMDTATRVHAGWHKQYPNFRKANAAYEALAKEWRDENGNPGGKFQYIRLFNNRVRHYHLFKEEENPPYYTAFNSLIQGTGGVLTEMSLLRIVDEFPDNDLLRPIACVHDSIIGEIKEGYVDEILPRIKYHMINWDFNPRLDAEAKIGKCWGEMKKYEFV